MPGNLLDKLDSEAVESEQNQGDTYESQSVDHTIQESDNALSVPVSDTTPSAEQSDLTLDVLTGEHVEKAAQADDGAQGPVRLNKDGTIAKKRGRKPGQKSATVSGPVNSVSNLPPVNQPENAASDNQPQKISTEESARWSANIVFNVGGFVFGDELGKPKDKDEANAMKAAFKNYYDVKGTPNIPPEIGLLLAIGFYAAPRLRHESMSEKVGRWIDGVKGFFRKKVSQDKKPNDSKPIPEQPKKSAMSWGA